MSLVLFLLMQVVLALELPQIPTIQVSSLGNDICSQQNTLKLTRFYKRTILFDNRCPDLTELAIVLRKIKILDEQKHYSYRTDFRAMTGDGFMSWGLPLAKGILQPESLCQRPDLKAFFEDKLDYNFGPCSKLRDVQLRERIKRISINDFEDLTLAVASSGSDPAEWFGHIYFIARVRGEELALSYYAKSLSDPGLAAGVLGVIPAHLFAFPAEEILQAYENQQRSVRIHELNLSFNQKRLLFEVLLGRQRYLNKTWNHLHRNCVQLSKRDLETVLADSTFEWTVPHSPEKFIQILKKKMIIQ